MKAVDQAGLEVERRGAERPDAGSVLRELDVATLRQFLIQVMMQGGVPVETMGRVMRCGRATIYRNAQPADPGS